MFNANWMIQKKRDGEELSKDEIWNLIKGITDSTVADYQASAFLMAVYFQGMTLQETVSFTEAMLASGERYDLSALGSACVDKHSTGGVGDKVSLILAPLAAACGLKVPMMSGRGLGFSGGTLDKLESIPGFKTQLSRSEFEKVLKSVGCAMIGQSATIAPADKKLYALRDVTGTVECVPLIVASILSKKLAEGTQALVLDVKVGSGAFMKTKPQAKKLSSMLVNVAKKLKLPCRALITNMDQPLGYAVGNALEVQECIEIMKNEKSAELPSADLKELTIHLCAHMLELGGVVNKLTEGRKLAHQRLSDGSAWRIFQKLVAAQGGDLTASVEKAPIQVKWTAKKAGHLTKMNTENIGRILIELGGGRKKASDSIDPAVGMVFHKKLGNLVREGDELVTVHARTARDLPALEALFQESLEISTVRKTVPKLIMEQVS